MPRKWPHIRIDIYENHGGYPVVSHIFYGKTVYEALSYLEAHTKSDKFLRAAMTTKRYKGIELRVVIRTSIRGRGYER